jgi:hypothetical protein
MSPPCNSYSSIFTSTGGPICNGNGYCQNNTCICNEGWTGAADFFSLDGVSCHNPIILDRILYGLGALSWILLWITSLSALQHHYHRWRKLNNGKHKLFSIRTFRTATHLFVIGMLMFPVLPLLIATFILRAASTQHIGVDPIISFMYAIGFCFQWGLAMMAQHLMLESMLRGGMKLNQDDIDRLILMDRQSIMRAVTIYSCALFSTCVAGIFIPVGVTPARITITALRNISQCCWFAYAYQHTNKIQKEIRETMTTMSNAHKQLAVSPGAEPQPVSPKVVGGGGGGGGGGGSSSDASNNNTKQDPIKRALEHLDKNAAAQKLLVELVVPILIVFTVVPQLYPYSYLPVAVLIILGAGRNHTLQAWKPSSSSKKSVHEGSQQQQQQQQYRGGNNNNGSASDPESSLKNASAYVRTRQQESSAVGSFSGGA